MKVPGLCLFKGRAIGEEEVKEEESRKPFPGQRLLKWNVDLVENSETRPCSKITSQIPEKNSFGKGFMLKTPSMLRSSE